MFRIGASGHLDSDPFACLAVRWLLMLQIEKASTVKLVPRLPDAAGERCAPESMKFTDLVQLTECSVRGHPSRLIVDGCQEAPNTAS